LIRSPLEVEPAHGERWRWTGEGPRYLKLNGGRVVARLQDEEEYEPEQLCNSTRIP
jgi:hypothetical protein